MALPPSLEVQFAELLRRLKEVARRLRIGHPRQVRLSADASAYTTEGLSADLERNVPSRTLNADAQSFSVTGVAATLNKTTASGNPYSMPAVRGTYSTTGVAASLTPAIASTYPTTFDFYLSPTGNNAANGLTPATAWKTFAKAFSTMGAGKRLGLLNGTYSIAAGTGCINFLNALSGQVPSGSAAAFTEVCSVNPGGAIIDGTGDYQDTAVWIGRSTRKDSWIKIRGIKALTVINLYHSERCYIKDCGAKYGIGIGTNDVVSGTTLFNQYNIIEDCWAWGAGVRLLSSNYQAHNNVWRRFVFRKDGGGPSGSGNPNVGFTVYNSKNCSVMNAFSLDRLADPSPYADFATAQHDGSNADKANFYFGGNKWLGCASINSADSAFLFEADNAQAGLTTWTLRNCVAYPGGLNINTASGTSGTQGSAIVENFTSIGDQVRLRDLPLASIFRNSIVVNSASFGVNANAAMAASYIDRFNNAGGDNITVTNGFTFNPLTGTPASLTYPLRIEAGSSAKGVGFGGGDVGANIVYRYGLDGTFRDDPDCETLTAVPLWPYPNEARIKADMAADSTRGFCATGETLTHYIWNRLGNGSPY